MHRPQSQWRAARRRRIWAIRIVLLALLLVVGTRVVDTIRGGEEEIVVAFEGNVVEMVGTAEGESALPDGATAFDDHYPGVANLDPRLRDALRAATALAQEDGVSIQVSTLR